MQAINPLRTSLTRSWPSVRTFTTTPVRGQAVTAYPQTQKKPIGGFRGGLIGFLLGLTVAGGTGYYYLFDDYHAASNLLLSVVEELQKSTNKVRDYTSKIERIDAELKALQEKSVTREQLLDLRTDVKKLYDALNIQQLELKNRVWTLEQDLSRIENFGGQR
ncbi:4896_t:CDS:2 [Paraglomus brasilianum]|uniref:4896_t:CDS:1 n=1 Tax=Paraglomus brasilianum TaxID=144538 RepID=A0A9N9F8P1_9GLOM|nr:4896_t:CDS:2 [Paraglomus brasilianum]